MHDSNINLFYVCICSCMRMCLCTCACMRCACVYIHLYIMCNAGPEVAVLDWYGPEADPGYSQWGRGGAGGRT